MAGAFSEGSLLRLCIAALVVSAAFYVVNIGLLGLLFARLRAQPVLQTLRGTLVSTTVPFAVMASLSVILVALWDRSPYLAIALVGPLVSIALYQRRQHETLDRLRELDRLKDEFIAIALDDATPRVAADGEKVKQVLVNLIENAVKYSTGGGAIEVSLRNVDDRVRFSVRDDGLGIPLVEQQRIFEKFHRLDPNMTRGVGGTGLGLYICKQLVDQMNGRIWVASREGEGSTFAFELPPPYA